MSIDAEGVPEHGNWGERSLTPTLPLPIARVDAAGRILEQNASFARELGDGDGARRASLFDAVADGREALEAALASAGPAAVPVELTFKAPASARRRTLVVIADGDHRWIIGQPAELDVQRTTRESDRRRAVARADESDQVTRQLRQANELLAQRARQLEDATTAKARFLATMSHELRTPLNAVLGYAGLLRDGVYGPLPEAQEHAVLAIVHRAHDLQTLIDDILDLSRIETGRMEVRLEEFDPAVVLREVCDSLGGAAREKELEIGVRSAMPSSVRLDRARYRQVLFNLVSNAVKFTPAHGHIELSVEPGDAAGPDFITRVRDTGIGIAPEQVDRIFESFQQVDTGTTRRYPGIGLGLAVVRRIVMLLGGTIRVESAPGRGATFVVTLPRTPAGAEDVERAAAAERGSGDGDPIVVAIDDDPEVIALLRDSLAPVHYRVVGALSGDRGIALAHALHPLAITLDIMMPEKDGWQVLRELKADPELRRVPVIVMSIVAERALGFSLGVSEYLVKPVDRRVLLGVLDRLRRERPAASALGGGGARMSA